MPAQTVLRRAVRILFPFDAEKTWAVLSERHRYTRAVRQLMGLPGGLLIDPLPGPIAFLVSELPQTSGVVSRILFSPEQWQKGRYVEIRCLLQNMPLLDVTIRHEIVAADADGTVVEISVLAGAEEASPAAEGMLDGMTGLHQRVTTDAMERARSGLSPYVDLTPRPESEHMVQRAQSLLRSSDVRDTDSLVLRRLCEWLGSADEADLRRMRPVELANRFGVTTDLMLRLCLQAAKAGVLEMQWDVLCPVCKRPPTRAAHLCDLHAQNRCPTCDLEFECDMDTLTEVTFRPSVQLRAVTDTIYCTAGPDLAPHVESQLLVAPQEERTLVLSLTPGRYLMCCQRTRLCASLVVTESGPQNAALVLSSDGISPAEIELASSHATLSIRSNLPEERLFSIEREGWQKGILTAAQVCASQDFRVLFPREALASGEQIRIRKLAFLFTDLRGSTSFYEALGDGPAYGIVREHFDLLTRHIAEHHGAVVKTIGDAVMAVFVDPSAALSAALAVQADLPAWNRRRPGIPALTVRMGIHSGPCIAVNANDYLDYFGTTVNLAARIQSQGQGADIVMLRSLAEDPSLAERLHDKRKIHFSSPLAGMSGTFDMVRIDCGDGRATLS